MKIEDYNVGWICALPTEMAAAACMLDERHEMLPQPATDDNNYTLGRIGPHNVVVACLPAGVTGVTSAARVAENMRATFTSLRFGLMVGIGGGVPSDQHDIRLGDVVVSKPGDTSGGVIQYDFGKTVQQGRFARTGSLNKPPDVLLSAVNSLQARHMYEESQLPKIMADSVARYPLRQKASTYLGADSDRLYPWQYDHPEGETTCHRCDSSELGSREPRGSDEPRVHYGLIASGNQVMRDGKTRERLRQELNVLCFEMEAAGLMDRFPCLVVRGICDYADSHKNKQWQDYAAATAAAYTKELLGVIPSQQVSSTREANSTVGKDDIRTVSHNYGPVFHNYGRVSNQAGQQNIHGDRSEIPPRPSSLIPFRCDRDLVEGDVLNDIWHRFIKEEIPIGTAFKLEVDGGTFAETQLAFSAGEVINSAENKCQGRTCTKDHDDSVSDCPMKAVYVCEDCEGATYCKSCALESLLDPKDYHKANHRLRCWRPIRRFRMPTSIVELNPATVMVSPACAEKAAAERKSYVKRQQRSSVMRLFLPAPKLDPSVHNCTKLKVHFCLDYLPVKYTDTWLLDKMVKMSMEKSGVVKVLVKRISLPTAPWDIFHSSNGYSEHWRQNVKPKKESQPYVVDLRILPAANFTEHDGAIEVAIHFVQDFTAVLPNGELLAPYQFKLRFESATMSTKDKIVRFVSRGEVLQVEKSEQNGDTSLQGWEHVDDDHWDFDAKDHQALGRKAYTGRDLINDIRGFWGKDPILDDSSQS